MSDERVEALRPVYAEWAEGNFKAGLELYGPETELVQGPDFPDSGTYVGPEEIRRYMRGFLEPWTRITIIAEEIVAGPDGVLVSVVQEGEGAGSGITTQLRYFHVWTFRAGKLTRWENFRKRSEAERAAGLSG